MRDQDSVAACYAADSCSTDDEIEGICIAGAATDACSSSRGEIIGDWIAENEEDLLDCYYALLHTAQLKGGVFDRASFAAFADWAFTQSSPR